jgi:hypothetical protein
MKVSLTSPAGIAGAKGEDEARTAAPTQSSGIMVRTGQIWAGRAAVGHGRQRRSVSSASSWTPTGSSARGGLGRSVEGFKGSNETSQRWPVYRECSNSGFVDRTGSKAAKRRAKAGLLFLPTPERTLSVAVCGRWP